MKLLCPPQEAKAWKHQSCEVAQFKWKFAKRNLIKWNETKLRVGDNSPWRHLTILQDWKLQCSRKFQNCRPLLEIVNVNTSAITPANLSMVFRVWSLRKSTKSLWNFMTRNKTFVHKLVVLRTSMYSTEGRRLQWKVTRNSHFHGRVP